MTSPINSHSSSQDGWTENKATKSASREIEVTYLSGEKRTMTITVKSNSSERLQRLMNKVDKERAGFQEISVAYDIGGETSSLKLVHNAERQHLLEETTPSNKVKVTTIDDLVATLKGAHTHDVAKRVNLVVGMFQKFYNYVAPLQAERSKNESDGGSYTPSKSDSSPATPLKVVLENAKPARSSPIHIEELKDDFEVFDEIRERHSEESTTSSDESYQMVEDDDDELEREIDNSRSPTPENDEEAIMVEKEKTSSRSPSPAPTGKGITIHLKQIVLDETTPKKTSSPSPSPIHLDESEDDSGDEITIAPLLKDASKDSSREPVSPIIIPKVEKGFFGWVKSYNPFADSLAKQVRLLKANLNKPLGDPKEAYATFLKNLDLKNYTPASLYRFLVEELQIKGEPDFDLIEAIDEQYKKELKSAAFPYAENSEQPIADYKKGIRALHWEAYKDRVIPQLSAVELADEMKLFWKALTNDRRASPEEPSVPERVYDDYMRSRSYIINKTLRYSNRRDFPNKDKVSQVKAELAAELSPQIADHLLFLNSQGRFVGYVLHLRQLFPSYHFSQAANEFGMQYAINTRDHPPSTTILGVFKATLVNEFGENTVGYFPIKIKTDLIIPIGLADPGEFKEEVHAEIFPLTQDEDVLRSWFEDNDLTK